LLYRFFVESGDLDHIMGLLALPAIIKADSVNTGATGAIEKLCSQNPDACSLV
jgi:hypothetical protein